MKYNSKQAAAISAVISFIKSQEEAAMSMGPESEGVSAVEQPTAETPQGPMPVWRVSGRQQQMQMRNLMQIKALHRLTGWRR